MNALDILVPWSLSELVLHPAPVVPILQRQAKPFRKKGEDVQTVLVRGLWRAVPAPRSENDVAEKVAIKLRGEGERASVRTIRNWLRGEATPHWRVVPALLRILPREERDKITGGDE